MNVDLLFQLTQWLSNANSRVLGSVEIVFNESVERAVALGLPLFRVSTQMSTMHPEVEGLELEWWRGRGTSSRKIGRKVLESDAFRGSPIEEVLRTRTTLRCRLEQPGERARFPQLAELANRGATDYVVLHVPLTHGRNTCLTAATDKPGGFGTYDLIPSVHFVRSRLAVKVAWKPAIDRVVTFEVTDPLPADTGTVGPQIDTDAGHYLPGGGSQFEMKVPAKTSE